MRDGSIVRRGGGIVNAAPERRAEVVAGFEFCPVVIRRHDVESFWAIPSSQRQDFFFDYLRDPGGIAHERETVALELARKSARKTVEKTRTEIQGLLGKSFRLPETYVDTIKFFKTKLMPKFGENHNGKRMVPARIYRPFVRYQEALERSERLDRASRSDLIEELPERQLQTILAKISDGVTANFATIVGKDWVSRISVSLRENSSMEISLELVNGGKADPTQVLNEAALDVLALLILVEVHIECAELGQQKIIVLDDVFQSVDSVHRVRSLEHVISRLHDWQVVLTLHDRLWLELARNAIQRRGSSAVRVIEVRAASYSNAPNLITSGDGIVAELEIVMANDLSPALVVGAAGRCLEQLCDRLSVGLGTSVTRRKEDKYTLGDLWPGVSKAITKMDIGAFSNEVNVLNASQVLRNISGAHYNQWADALSRQEAVDFASAVQDLWRLLTCDVCGSVVAGFRPPQGARTLFGFPCKCSDRAGTDLTQQFE